VARELGPLGQFVADPANGVVILRKQDAAQLHPRLCGIIVASTQVADQGVQLRVVVAAFTQQVETTLQ
jgi:hypothetical protein